MDLNFNHEQKCFNLKVAAVVQKDNQILFKRPMGDDHYTLPGGRVKFGETTEQAIVREVDEELNIQITIKKLLLINENFFEYDTDEYHEVLFIYLCESSGSGQLKKIDEDDKQVQWININELQQFNIDPSHLIDDLKQLPTNIKHKIVNK